MKKILLAVLVLGAMGVTSCKKCKTCSKTNYNDVEICRGEGPGSNAVFRTEEASYELDGYVCN